MPIDMVGEAVRYMDMGWYIFPVNGKIPATEHGVLDASNAIGRVSEWWQHSPDRGIGLATGAPSGVWVLDIDGPDGLESLRRFQVEHGKLPRTPTAKTANGWHLFWAMPDGADVRNSAGKVAPGIDVRGTGGYVVLPPSLHPSGDRYEWRFDPDDARLVESPFSLIQQAAAPPTRTVAEELPSTITAGSRNDRLASLAGSMRRRGASAPSILAALEEENRLKCSPSLESDEVAKIAESVGRYEPATNGKPVSVAVIDRVAPELLVSMGADKTKPVDAVSTPWPAWNAVSRGAGGGQGLARGWHIIVGASSGAGKSLWATNMAGHAVLAGHDVCLISLEMSQSEVLTRLLSIVRGGDVRELEHGLRFSQQAWSDASEALLAAPGTFNMNRVPFYALDQIEATVRAQAGDGARLVIVDYLQLAWLDHADTMYQQITEVSHAIRALAVELGITMVGISQINRQASAHGAAPAKEGLIGGSSLENDADQVVMLGRPERADRGYRVKATLDKNRHGPRVDWSVELDTQSLRMRELLPDEQASYAV